MYSFDTRGKKEQSICMPIVRRFVYLDLSSYYHLVLFVISSSLHLIVDAEIYHFNKDVFGEFRHLQYRSNRYSFY